MIYYVLLYATVINTLWPKERGRKGSFHSADVSSIFEESQGREWGREYENRKWSRGHGRVLFPGLLFLTCTVCFVLQPRTSCRGMAPSAVGGLFYINHQSRMLCRFAKANLMGPFSQLSLLLRWFSLCQVTSNRSNSNNSEHTSTVGHWWLLTALHGLLTLPFKNCPSLPAQMAVHNGQGLPSLIIIWEHA